MGILVGTLVGRNVGERVTVNVGATVGLVGARDIDGSDVGCEEG